MNSYPSILILTYNRLNELELLLGVIKKIKYLKLYISNDGPKNELDKLKVDAVQKLILDNFKDNKNVSYKFQKKNRGCKIATEEAINWFFENEEQGIILEDDCIPDPSFFEFSNELLNYYKNDERIWLISGTNLETQTFIESSYFFSNLGGIHGWATWKRCWDKYISDFEGIHDYINFGGITSQFHPKVAKKRIKQFKQVKKYKIKSWAYCWGFTRHFYNGLSIIPKYNLINNVGFNSTSNTHNFGIKYHKTKIKHIEFPLIHPKGIFPNSKYDIYASKEMNLLMKIINVLRFHETPFKYYQKKIIQYLNL